MRALALLPCLALPVACAPPSIDDPFATLSVGTTMTTGMTTSASVGTDDSGSGSGSETGGTDDTVTTTTSPTTTTGQDTSGDGSSSSTGPAVCGDGTRSGDEACDGEDFGEESCSSQGFMGGELVCDETCAGFSTEGCFICGNGTLEGTEECEMDVPFTNECVDQGYTAGTLTCDTTTCLFDVSACSLCGDGVVSGDEACDSDDLAGSSCASIGFDGGALACDASDCTFDFGGCTGTNLDCAEQVIGSTSPQSIVGNTSGEDDDFVQSCGSSGGPDYLVAFIAPSDGTYHFDAIGSSYDTVMSAYSDCNGTEIACNDDFAGNPLCGSYACSQLDIAMTDGQQIVVAMSGYSGGSGAFTLNVSGP